VAVLPLGVRPGKTQETLTLPRLDIRSAMAQSYQLLISDRCSSLLAAAVPHRQAGELDDWR